MAFTPVFLSQKQDFIVLENRKVKTIVKVSKNKNNISVY